MKEVETMTNQQFNQYLETIIILLQTTQDTNKVIEYIRQIQQKE